jgi:hypothetical protein
VKTPLRDIDTLVRVLETDFQWLKRASRLADRAYESQTLLAYRPGSASIREDAACAHSSRTAAAIATDSEADCVPPSGVADNADNVR